MAARHTQTRTTNHTTPTVNSSVAATGMAFGNRSRDSETLEAERQNC